MKGTASPALLQIVGRSGPFKTSSVESLDRRPVPRGAADQLERDSKLKLLNKLPMESYLYGVVPARKPGVMAHRGAQGASHRRRARTRMSGEASCTATRAARCTTGTRGARVARARVMHEDARTNSAVSATSGKCVAYKGNVDRNVLQRVFGRRIRPTRSMSGAEARSRTSEACRTPTARADYDPWSTTGRARRSRARRRRSTATISGEPTGAGTTVYVKSLSIDHTWPTGFAKSVTVRWSDGTSSSGISATTWRQALGLRSNKFFSNASG